MLDDRIFNPDRSFAPQLSSMASRLGLPGGDKNTHAKAAKVSLGGLCRCVAFA